MTLTKSDIEDAVRCDYKWLTGPAQNYQSWSGTQPADVGPLDFPEGAVVETISGADVSDERHDELLAYAESYWRSMA